MENIYKDDPGSRALNEIEDIKIDIQNLRMSINILFEKLTAMKKEIEK